MNEVKPDRIRTKNKEKIYLRNKAHLTKKKENDPAFQAYVRLSNEVQSLLEEKVGNRKVRKTKKNPQPKRVLPFSWQAYKKHMENEFGKLGNEWISWANYGFFNERTWSNEDPNSWTWEYDYIISIEKLPHTFRTGKNFNKFWGLANLCAISAKQKSIDDLHRIEALKRKVCNVCGIEQPAENFPYDKMQCRNCLAIKKRLYKEENKEALAEADRKYREEHKEERRAYERKYEEDNKIAIRKRKAKRARERRSEDFVYRNRGIISNRIYEELHSNRGSKRGKSCFDFLGWKIEEYILHMEAGFSLPENLTIDGKIWMTWKNQGKYSKKTWNDNDPETWKWQQDHIKPVSDFEYQTMDCQEFRDCWALSNLRPLNAKQNLLDGTSRIRHK